MRLKKLYSNFFTQNSIFYDFFNETFKPHISNEDEDDDFEIDDSNSGDSSVVTNSNFSVSVNELFCISNDCPDSVYVNQKFFSEMNKLNEFMNNFVSTVFLPFPGTMLCVFYFDNNFVARFFWGMCTKVSKNGCYSSFSIYQKIHGFSINFFPYSPFFIGFIPLFLQKKYIRKSVFFKRIRLKNTDLRIYFFIFISN